MVPYSVNICVNVSRHSIVQLVLVQCYSTGSSSSIFATLSMDMSNCTFVNSFVGLGMKTCVSMTHF